MQVENVKKFGGSSMAQPEVVASLLESEQAQQFVVVSAPGKDEQYDVKMTDRLIQYRLASEYGLPDCAEIEDEIIHRFEGLYSSLGDKALAGMRTRIGSLMRSIDAEGNAAYFPSLGETISAECFGQLIGAKVLEPSIVFKGGKLDRTATRQAVADAGDLLGIFGGDRFVVPGFYGFERRPSGFKRRELLGRGGSDRTGALYAAAWGVPYLNMTDVDGVMSADPRIVPSAQVVPELTRKEVREGALGGSGVFQGDTVIDLSGSDVVTRIANTFNPDSPGTLVTVARDVDTARPVAAISGKKIRTLHIEDLGMAEAEGYIARVTGAASRLHMPLELMPAGHDEVTLTFDHEDVDDNQMSKLADKCSKNAMSEHHTVAIRDNLAIAHIVGEALRNPEISRDTIGQACAALKQGGVALHTIISNPDSPRLAFMVDDIALNKAITLLHADLIERT